MFSAFLRYICPSKGDLLNKLWKSVLWRLWKTTTTTLSNPQSRKKKRSTMFVFKILIIKGNVCVHLQKKILLKKHKNMQESLNSNYLWGERLRSGIGEKLIHCIFSSKCLNILL